MYFKSNGIPVPPERDIPFDVPYREVEHEQREDYDVPDRTLQIGSLRDAEYWDSQEAWDRDRKEFEERDKRRAKLGGFGFRIERA